MFLFQPSQIRTTGLELVWTQLAQTMIQKEYHGGALIHPYPLKATQIQLIFKLSVSVHLPPQEFSKIGQQVAVNQGMQKILQ